MTKSTTPAPVPPAAPAPEAQTAAPAPEGAAETAGTGAPAGSAVAYIELKSISKEEFATVQPNFINAVASVGPLGTLAGLSSD